MTTELRCLAIRQPWAWAIVAGVKDIENRTWTTDYRGPVVIQASSTKTAANALMKEHRLPARELTYGALIGVADLEDVVPLSEELEANPWAWGPHCWIFRNAKAFLQPIPLKGKLNLYTLAAAVAEKACAEIATAVSVEHDATVQVWLEAMMRADAGERAEAHFESYITLGDTLNAMRVARSRIAAARTADTLSDLARAQLVADDVTTALQTASEAIESDEKNARAWFVRSMIYSTLADRDQAKAAELDPRFGEEGEPEDDETDAD